MIPWLAITGCVAEEPGLDGTWQLQSVDQARIEASSPDDLPHFTIKGTAIEGFDGCNEFGGSIDQPGAISVTRRACLDVETMLPLDLNALDTHLEGAQVDGDTLSVPAKDTFPASTYRRQTG